MRCLGGSKWRTPATISAPRCIQSVPAASVPELRARECRQRQRAGLALCQPEQLVRRSHRWQRRAQFCADPRRPCLRQQRAVGYVPHRVACLCAVCTRGRRAGARISGAGACRRLGGALVLAGLRRPDGGHQFGCGLCRCLAQGRARVRSGRGLRRCVEERHRGAARPARGAQGMARSTFRGYADTDTHEGMSWSMEGALNDFGIAGMADALAQQTPDAVARERYATEALYFRHRAAGYAALFDPAIGFFRAVRPMAAGAWMPRTTIHANGATITPNPAAGPLPSPHHTMARAWPRCMADAMRWRPSWIRSLRRRKRHRPRFPARIAA